MSIASRIEAIEEHIGDVYDTIDLAKDTTGTNKNIVNIPTKLKDAYVDIINNGTDTLYNNFPKQTGTGETLSLTPTYQAPMKIDLKGNTSQVQLTGKNLFNITDYQNISISNNQNPTNVVQTSNSISFLSNGSNNYSGIYISATDFANYVDNYNSDTTYCLSADIIVDKACYIGSLQATGNYVNVPVGKTRISLYSKVLSAISFYVRNAVSGGVNVKIEKIMVATTNDTDFEQYCGGIPSPNPDYPQDINVVSGNNTIKICGKNIFDKDNPNIISGYYLNDDGVETSNSNFNISDYMNVIPNTIYSLQPYRNNTACLCYYDENKTFISSTRLNTINPNFTTPINAKYIKLSFRYDTHDIQIEKGSTATTYEAYQSQTYPITLPTGMELCKIGNYQDSFVYDNDKWYKRANVGKVVLDGSENNWSSENAYTGYYRYFCAGIYPSLTRGNNGLNNRFTQRTNQQHGDYQYLYIQENNGYLHIQILQSELTDGNVNTFKTWLSNNNVDTYYVLTTQTDTEITDTTLINQLEAIRLNALSYNGTTNILQTNNDLPFIIDASCLKGA